MRTVTLTLPEPPSLNRAIRHYGNHAVKSKEAEDYALTVYTCYMEQVAAPTRKFLPFTGEVSITLTWFRGRRAGDLDNRMKVLFDCLNRRVWADDQLVVALHAFRVDDPKNGRMELSVSEVG